MKKALSLDIGGTNLRCALINENYEIEKVIVKSTSNSTVEVFLKQVEEIIEEVGVTDDVVAISMGVPGRVRWDGYVYELPNIGIKSLTFVLSSIVISAELTQSLIMPYLSL